MQEGHTRSVGFLPEKRNLVRKNIFLIIAHPTVDVLGIKL